MAIGDWQGNMLIRHREMWSDPDLPASRQARMETAALGHQY